MSLPVGTPDAGQDADPPAHWTYEEMEEALERDGFVDLTTSPAAHRQLATRRRTQLVPVPRKGIRKSTVALLVATIMAGATIITGLSTTLLTRQPPSPAQSTCLVAVHNVKDARDAGVIDPAVMARINPDDIDRQCGTEAEILKGMKP